jgi:cytochrome c551/c552
LIRRLTRFSALPLLAGLALSCRAAPAEGVDPRDLEIFSPEAMCAFHIGDPRVGEEIFHRPVLGEMGGCATCHSLERDAVLVGPSLFGIADAAGERVRGVTAANYIYISIVLPDHYIVAGYQPGVMPQDYLNALEEDELTNLVSFLMNQIRY